MTKRVRFRSSMKAGAAVALLLASSPAALSADLVVTAYGGLWEKAFRECYVTTFEKQTGKKVEVVLGTPVQWSNQILASPNKPPIDVIINGIDQALDAGRRGVVEKYDVSKVPNLKDIDPKFAEAGQGFGSILNYGAMGLAYNEKKIPNPPKTWKEFVDRTVAGEWHAAIPGVNYAATPNTLIWMLAHVYGGDVDNVEPAFDQIKRLRASGNIVFWNDVNEFLNLIKSGEVDIGMYWDGRTWAFHDAGNPTIKYLNPQPGAVISPVIIQKVKNGSELGWEFINHALSAPPQQCWGNILQYGMSNSKVEFLPAVSPRITKLPEILWPPFGQLAPKVSGWVEKWNKELGR